MKIQQTRNTMSTTYLDAMKIRQLVFVQGQGISKSLEIDQDETRCLYFVLYSDSDKPLATCRMLPNSDNNEVILQRMAVLPDYRGQHLGRLLLDHVLSFCAEQRISKIVLHAQTSVLGFYQKMGFKQFGSEFEEAGIKHLMMEKEL